MDALRSAWKMQEKLILSEGYAIFSPRAQVGW